MKLPSIWRPLLKRELRALLSHRSLMAGWGGALLSGIAIAFLGAGDEARVWILYQLIYYALPLLAMLGTIMLVRQDLREGPLLAHLPGASAARVGIKAAVSFGYFAILLGTLVLPSALRGAFPAFLRLVGGSLPLLLVFVGFGAWWAFRARSEIRAYFGGLATWLGFLLGSGALAYGAHLWLAPETTPAATLAILMSNPLECFRIFVFFGIDAVPMNPQTASPIAVWWLRHTMTWLLLISTPFIGFSLLHAGWNLRLRAHDEGG